MSFDERIFLTQVAPDGSVGFVPTDSPNLLSTNSTVTDPGSALSEVHVESPKGVSPAMRAKGFSSALDGKNFSFFTDFLGMTKSPTSQNEGSIGLPDNDSNVRRS
jgi:hypothetical protein